MDYVKCLDKDPSTTTVIYFDSGPLCQLICVFIQAQGFTDIRNKLIFLIKYYETVYASLQE